MQKIQKSKQFVEKMCHLYNSAIKLGGNIYEVAKQSGFLSAFTYFTQWLEEEENWLSLNLDRMMPVTECYVQLENSNETDKIFLYSSILFCPINNDNRGIVTIKIAANICFTILYIFEETEYMPTSKSVPINPNMVVSELI